MEEQKWKMFDATRFCSNQAHPAIVDVEAKQSKQSKAMGEKAQPAHAHFQASQQRFKAKFVMGRYLGTAGGLLQGDSC